LLYTDAGIPFEEYGLGTAAEIYNAAGLNFRNQSEGVYFSKSRTGAASSGNFSALSIDLGFSVQALAQRRLGSSSRPLQP
jgi:hypothetical protein